MRSLAYSHLIDVDIPGFEPISGGSQVDLADRNPVVIRENVTLPEGAGTKLFEFAPVTSTKMAYLL
jgi:hypothetical protein